jgi:hypothetical protein
MPSDSFETVNSITTWMSLGFNFEKITKECEEIALQAIPKWNLPSCDNCIGSKHYVENVKSKGNKGTFIRDNVTKIIASARERVEG